MKKPYVNVGTSFFSKENVEIIEEKYEAKYVADLCLKTKTGYTEFPVAVFYQEKLKSPEHSHYFGLYYDYDTRLTQSKRLLIVNANSVSEGEWYGKMAKSGEIIFSRFAHDMRHCKTDDKVWVDGGRYYMRSGIEGTDVALKINEGNFEIVKAKKKMHDELYLRLKQVFEQCVDTYDFMREIKKIIDEYDVVFNSPNKLRKYFLVAYKESANNISEQYVINEDDHDEFLFQWAGFLDKDKNYKTKFEYTLIHKGLVYDAISSDLYNDALEIVENYKEISENRKQKEKQRKDEEEEKKLMYYLMEKYGLKND